MPALQLRMGLLNREPVLDRKKRKPSLAAQLRTSPYLSDCKT